MENNPVNKEPAIQDSTHNQQPSVLKTSLITSIVTSVVVLMIFVLVFKPLGNIKQNSNSIELQQKQLSEIKEQINVSRQELELQVRNYIDKNYGVLSERDEKVDKLVIYFRQQDARLSNIEKALATF